MNVKSWSTKKKIAVGVLVFIIFLILIPPPKKDIPQAGKINVQGQTESTVVNTASPQQVETVLATVAPTQKAVATSSPKETANVTVSQSNALRKAKSYLSYSAFSLNGLVAQLEYEQFSHADSVYAADNVGADWNEQAAIKAKTYMNLSGYSRGSLIEQLKYEKFTQAQAEYGANAVGL